MVTGAVNPPAPAGAEGCDAVIWAFVAPRADIEHLLTTTAMITTSMMNPNVPPTASPIVAPKFALLLLLLLDEVGDGVTGGAGVANGLGVADEHDTPISLECVHAPTEVLNEHELNSVAELEQPSEVYPMLSVEPAPNV